MTDAGVVYGSSNRDRRQAGTVRSSDGVLALDLVLPTELGGPGGAATNPEQLFAAGYPYSNAVRGNLDVTVLLDPAPDVE